MKEKLKNRIISICFIIIITVIMFINIIIPDKDISYTERRVLRKYPKCSSENLLNGEYFEKLEKYFLDQFIFRDIFRSIKAYTKYYILNQKDNNDIYILDDYIYKMSYPLNEKAVLNATRKYNEIYDKCLKSIKDINISYSIIPDKNYFVASDSGYLHLDYIKMIKIMNENIKNMKYINLFEILDIDDYYRTDLHWEQNKIIDVSDYLLKKMNNEVALNVDYEQKRLYPFYGSYFGQVAIDIEADELVYLTNENIEKSLLFDHVYNEYTQLYIKDKFGEVDSYDFFLNGPKSVISIINSNPENEKQILIFRDSFASSLAPLLLKGYSKITLVDLRYISTDILEKYVDFSNYQDVLFLHNVDVINNSYMLK